VVKKRTESGGEKEGRRIWQVPFARIWVGTFAIPTTALYCYNRFRFQSRNLFIWGEIFLGLVRSDVQDAGIAGSGVMDLFPPISRGITSPFY
jgi:hypothetical protein